MVIVMDDINEFFRDFLYSQGLKYTPERRLVLEEVFEIHDHFEAEDLLFRVRTKGQRVSKGTIYRTLKLLVDSGLVREVAFIDKHIHYEHVYGHKHHEHLICEDCGRVINFYREEMEKALVEACKQNNFQMKSHKVEVVGYCQSCIYERERVQLAQSKSLRDLRPGDKCRVLKIKGNGELRHRLMEMGLVKGTVISVKRLAPLGDPIEVELKGYSLSLRGSDAANILVE